MSEWLPSRFPFSKSHHQTQVKELYGPLLAVVTASKSAFDAMVTQHSPNRSMKDFISAARNAPDGKDGQTYRSAPLAAFYFPSLPFSATKPVHHQIMLAIGVVVAQLKVMTNPELSASCIVAVWIR